MNKLESYIFIFVIIVIVLILLLIFFFSPVQNQNVTGLVKNSLNRDLYTAPLVDYSVMCEIKDRPRLYQTSESKIPKVIIQTGKKREVSKANWMSTQSILDHNPEYDYLYFDDKECDKFIKKHFPGETYNLYKTLVPGAYRSDFFRACYLYINGGVYFDLGFVSLVPLREIIEDEDLILVEDNLTSNYKTLYIYNAFMACVPGHILFKNYISDMIQNIKKKRYDLGVFGITGPAALGKALYDYLSRRHVTYRFGRIFSNDIRLKVLLHKSVKTCPGTGTIFEIKNNKYISLFQTRNLAYRTEQFLNSYHYSDYFRKKAVFGEKMLPPKQKKISSNKNVALLSFTHPKKNFEIVEFMPFLPVFKSNHSKIPNKVFIVGDGDTTYNMLNAHMTFARNNPEYYIDKLSYNDALSRLYQEGGILIAESHVSLTPFRNFISDTDEFILTLTSDQTLSTDFIATSANNSFIHDLIMGKDPNKIDLNSYKYRSFYWINSDKYMNNTALSDKRDPDYGDFFILREYSSYKHEKEVLKFK